MDGRITKRYSGRAYSRLSICFFTRLRSFTTAARQDHSLSTAAGWIVGMTFGGVCAPVPQFDWLAAGAENPGWSWRREPRHLVTPHWPVRAQSARLPTGTITLG